MTLPEEIRRAARLEEGDLLDPVVEGEAHVVWRRVGTHAAFDRP